MNIIGGVVMDIFIMDIMIVVIEIFIILICKILFILFLEEDWKNMVLVIIVRKSMYNI